MADLGARRDAFQDQMRRQAESGEAAWAETQAKLGAEWNDFQADVKKYIDRFGQQFKQQQATCQEIANAQLNAWREAVNSIQSASADLAAEHRAKIEAEVQRMKAGAATAEANFEKLRKAGSESWAAWNVALAESRSAFDRANQAAWDAWLGASLTDSTSCFTLPSRIGDLPRGGRSGRPRISRRSSQTICYCAFPM